MLVQPVDDELAVSEVPALLHVTVDRQVARVVVNNNAGGGWPPGPQNLEHAPGGLELMEGIEPNNILAVQAEARQNPCRALTMLVRVLRAHLLLEPGWSLFAIP